MPDELEPTPEPIPEPEPEPDPLADDKAAIEAEKARLAEESAKLDKRFNDLNAISSELGRRAAEVPASPEPDEPGLVFESDAQRKAFERSVEAQARKVAEELMQRSLGPVTEELAEASFMEVATSEGVTTAEGQDELRRLTQAFLPPGGVPKLSAIKTAAQKAAEVYRKAHTDIDALLEEKKAEWAEELKAQGVAIEDIKPARSDGSTRINLSELDDIDDPAEKNRLVNEALKRMG